MPPSPTKNLAKRRAQEHWAERLKELQAKGMLTEDGALLRGHSHFFGKGQDDTHADGPSAGPAITSGLPTTNRRGDELCFAYG